MKDYILIEVHRECILTPRLITCMIVFMFVLSAALMTLAS